MKSGNSLTIHKEAAAGFFSKVGIAIVALLIFMAFSALADNFLTFDNILIYLSRYPLLQLSPSG